MDNRKVYKSYRDKVKGFSHPYGSSSTITSKVKGILGLWNSIKQQSTTSSSSSGEQIQPFKFPQPRIVQSELKMPGAFHPQIPAPAPAVTETAPETASTTSTTTANPSSSPNKILSKFFQEKGNKPLTDIEYEGVMALMSKSKQGTPYKRSRVGSVDDSLIDQTFNTEPKRTKLDTPYTQKTLVATPDISISSPPEYNPTYHTIQNNTANSSFNKSVPSIKRVYQFSGLPSPYRTRIKPPSYNSSAIRRRKHLQDIRANKTLNNITIDNNTTTSFAPKSFVSGPSTSSTAKTLLSILDGNSQGAEVQEETSTTDKLKLFTNPYGTRIKSVSKPQNITANDIEKTILYDKSEPLPEPVINGSKTVIEEKNGTTSEVSIPPSNGTNGEITKKVESDIKPTAAFSFKKDTPSAAFTFNKDKPAAFTFNKDTPSAAFSFKKDTPPTTGFTFNKDTSSKSDANTSEVLKKDENKEPKDTIVDTSSTNGDYITPTNNESDKPKFEFEFPKVDVVEVVIDQKEVDKFKPMFEF
ncbi:Nucleoporin NUP60 [Spathaspora sp. JA1]|nr:Nucleoporin NUP60 [Spathaspora sp. JA1]